jgi:DNA primase
MTQGNGTDTTQLIKDKLSIVEVVQPYVKLTRAGKYFRGLSPFSKEKTPSFYVSPDRGSFYCFSTSQGGDHFTFIEKMEGVDFKGALKILADKAGVEIQQLTPGDRIKSGERDRLREAMSAADQLFASALTETTPAYTYAKERGLTNETIRSWNLGLAPSGWRGLLEALSAQGFTPKELAAAGLIKEADEKPGTWYDRFRSRLMFPIRDTAGRTVAFTGRALEKDEQAKYLNSPETDLFKKGEILFGMDRAKDSIRARGFAILVEGQFDLLLLHQAGFTNTIALSGTALSSVHLSLIKRYADNLMLALDADRAGLASSAKTALAALESGMRVKAVRLPQGKDPADVVAEDGGKTFTELVKNSQSIIEFFLSVLAAQETDDFKLMRRVEETVLPLVVAVKSPLERNRYVEIIARALSQTPEAVREALPQLRAGGQDASQTGSHSQSHSQSQSQNQNGYSNYQNQNSNQYPNRSKNGGGYEQGSRPPYRSQNGQGYSQNKYGTRSTSYGQYPQRSPAFPSYEDGGKDESADSSTEVSGLETRRTLILATIQAYPETPLAERLKTEYGRITGAPVDSAMIADLGERALFEAGLAYGEMPSEDAGDELLYAFERMILRDALKDATRQLRAAESANDVEGIQKAALRCTELGARIAALS